MSDKGSAFGKRSNSVKSGGKVGFNKDNTGANVIGYSPKQNRSKLVNIASINKN